ncbi:MAG: hypothetical protein GC179_08010 [Anaerolineaceae bacterium]|nr:hypothetical protein [Anaerolineaceae bacterium]
MGLRYDWEIEAEKTQVQRGSEGRSFARKRRAARLRFLIFVLIVITIFASLGAFVVLRLDAVEKEIEQSLRSTVEAEVTALRLGDFASYSAIQRSASADWLRVQQQIFNQYQDLKMQQGVQLTGEISALQVDRTRARVNVQEIVNGVPYTRVWFYWHYEDGWHHVPPDYTFWGELEVRKVNNVTVRYQMVDNVFGQAVVERIAAWFETACSSLNCGGLPDVTVEIIPDESLRTSWAAGNDWRLQIPSPYVRRARTDMPFDTSLQLEVALKIADRLVGQASNNIQPVYPTDATYLRQAISSWLVGQLVQVSTNSYLMDSLATNYGPKTVGQLASALKPDSSINMLVTITGKSLEETGLDWRDYLTWHLLVEDDLIQKRDETNFLGLYDTRDTVARELAYSRFNAALSTGKQVVTSVQTEVGTDGSVQLRAVVEVGEGSNVQQTNAVFRLADGVWKRIN